MLIIACVGNRDDDTFTNEGAQAVKQTFRVRILRDADGDVENVTVGESLAEILDVDANITPI